MKCRPFFNQGVWYYSSASHTLPADVQLSSDILQAKFRLSDYKSYADNTVAHKTHATVTVTIRQGPSMNSSKLPAASSGGSGL